MIQEIKDRFDNNLKSFDNYSITLRHYNRFHCNDLQSIVLSHGFKILHEIGGNSNNEYTLIYGIAN